MKRYECLKALASVVRENDLVVTNLGNTMHEWLSVRPSRANLYNMNLGQCTPVALGLALALPHRRVIALDGDGNLLMNLAALADVAYHKPRNLRIMVFDNQAYESPGGMPSATAHGVDLVEIAKGCTIANSQTRDHDPREVPKPNREMILDIHSTSKISLVMTTMALPRK